MYSPSVVGSGDGEVYLQGLATGRLRTLRYANDDRPEAVVFVGKLVNIEGTGISTSPMCYSTGLSIFVEVMTAEGQLICPPYLQATSSQGLSRLRSIIVESVEQAPILPTLAFQWLHRSSNVTCFRVDSDRVRFEAPVPHSRRVHMLSRPHYMHETYAYQKEVPIFDRDGAHIPYENLTADFHQSQPVHVEAIPCW